MHPFSKLGGEIQTTLCYHHLKAQNSTDCLWTWADCLGKLISGCMILWSAWSFYQKRTVKVRSLLSLTKPEELLILLRLRQPNTGLPAHYWEKLVQQISLHPNPSSHSTYLCEITPEILSHWLHSLLWFFSKLHPLSSLVQYLTH